MTILFQAASSCLSKMNKDEVSKSNGNSMSVPDACHRHMLNGYSTHVAYKNATHDILDELWSVSSDCFDSLEHINLSVLDDLLDASIGCTVNAGAGLTITETCQTRTD